MYVSSLPLILCINYLLLSIRFCGILHVMNEAITYCLQQQDPLMDDDLPEEVDPTITTLISKETAESAVNLTEYFQDQRKYYEDVSIHGTWNTLLMHVFC